MKARGATGIVGLGHVFKRMDNNGNKKFDRNEFMWGLRENGHTLSASEYERVFRFFDKNNDGTINYDEFLLAVRGPMDGKRVKFVKMAFDKLDKDGSGLVTVSDLCGTYDTSQHPDKINGTKTEAQILKEFMYQWDSNKDGTVTFEEFCDYYASVSASIDRDDYFELMMRNAWHLAGGEGQCENTTIKRELVIGPDGEQSV